MTTYKKKKLKDREGNYIVTPSSADMVYCQDGSTLEQKLNNIENDEFSPTITQIESMAKVGVGTDVDVSANVQEGYVKSAILKGNTKVNLIQESSSQDVVLPYEFTEGQYVTINDTKESGALGIELKGQTLVNLVEYDKKMQGLLDRDENGYYSYNLTEPTSTFFNAIGWKIPPSSDKTYFLVLEIQSLPKNTTFSVNKYGTIANIYFGSQDFTSIGIHKLKLTKKTSTPETPFSLTFGATTTETNAGLVKYRAMLLEYQEGMENWDIPYFEGMQSVQVPSVETVGKNLLNPSNLVDGIYNFTDGVFMESSEHLTTKTKIQIKPSTTYVLSYESETFKNYWFYQYDKNGKHIKSNEVASGKITTNENAQYIQVAFLKGNSTSKFQLEESSTPTTYEPHKSTTLTLPEEITLRGIGNVKDTLNTVTGEYTQRIGEITFTSETPVYTDGNLRFLPIDDDFMDNVGLAEKLPFITVAEYIENKIGVAIQYRGNKESRLYIRVNENNDIESIKTFITQNPFTFIGGLLNPIVKTVDLTIVDQDNKPTAKLSTYNTTTHINASSQEGSLIPTLSHVNPSYPVILKPSTKYSIVADSYSNEHTNSPINFNLGGATVSTTVGNRVSTVTTPSTLTSEKLVMSGRGNMLNNVMVIEGDVVGDEPYFEGMCDVEMPGVTNVGKNLFDGELDTNYYKYDGTNLFDIAIVGINSTVLRNVKPIKIKGNSNYSFSVDSNIITRFTFFDSKGNFIQTIAPSSKNSTSSFVSPQNASYFVFNTTSATSLEVANSAKFQIEESTTPTTYEPYKSNTLSCNSEVVLRSLPNGICDTLDLMTGEYVQRIGEVVLDGSEDWNLSDNLSEVRKCYVTALTNVKVAESNSVTTINNRMSSITYNLAIKDKQLGIFARTSTNGLAIVIDIENLIEFKTYLQANPITVQYELATPITTTIDLVPSGTNPTTKPFVWKDGHVQLLSKQGTLTPSLEYSVITSRGGQILDNTRQIAKQDKRIYDLEMLLISSSVEDAYQRLALQNSVQMLSYNEELKVNPIRYYMLSRLIEEGMYQESDMLDKLDAFFLYGEINTEQYYGLSKAIVGDNAIATLDEVIASHEIQVDIPTTLEELPTDKPSTLEEMPIDKPTTLEEEVLPSDRPTTLEDQPIVEEVEDAPIVELKDCSKTYTLLMNKLELSIQRVEDLAHYIDLANAYICANRLSYEEYELVIARIENAYISLH